MSEKVTLPKEVAEAIETLREMGTTGGTTFGLLQRVNECYTFGMQSGIIYRHFNGDMDALMTALINGYQVEQTAEDRLREYYNKMKNTAYRGQSGTARAQSVMEGVEKTLDILGIKIEGINA